MKKILVLSVAVLCLTGCWESEDKVAENVAPESVITEAPVVQEQPVEPGIDASLLKTGMSEAEFIEVVGRPGGIINAGGKRLLSYNGVVVTVEDGTITDIPGGFIDELEIAREDHVRNRSIHDAQREQGKVYYDGRWMTSGERDRLQVQALNQQRARETQARTVTRSSVSTCIPVGKVIYKQNGKPVDHSYLTSKGEVTVVVFYSDYYTSWATRCREIRSQISGTYRDDREIEVRRIDVGYYASTEKARVYNVTSVPEVRVFNKRGEMVGSPTSSFATVRQYVEFAKSQR